MDGLMEYELIRKHCGVAALREIKKMKNILLITITLLLSITTIAQKPAWADYYKRQSMYPDSEFLVGFVSGINTEDKDIGELKSVYEAIAKDKLIQGIQVEIESNNSLDISNVNGKSNEEFLSKSVSFSKANVSGLTTQSFYDRKKKEVYAISFVSKKELAYFYRNIVSSGIDDIEQKLSEGKKYAKKGNKENALKSFYEAMPVLSKIDEARVLLIALNRKMYADLDIDKINRLKLELINEIDLLIKPANLNLSESAYFVAYGIFLQLGDIQETLFMDDFSFENTGLTSEFSEKWNQEFASAIVKAGNYKVNTTKSSGGSQTLAFGNYWTEGDFLKINASVSKNNKIIAVSKGSISLSWLKKENIDFVPEQVKKMEALANVKLKLKSAPEVIKIGTASTEAVKIEAGINGKPIHSIPILIVNVDNGQTLCKGTTNDFGYAVCYLPPINIDKPILRLEANINLTEYLSIDENSVYSTIASQQNPVNSITIDIKTEKPTVFVHSEEKIQYYDMQIKTLEPSIKQLLAEKSYNFVDNEADADFIIIIKANTTTGTSYQGIYFAYLDANISVIDAKSGEEIYKSHLDQIKGGGANYKKAAKKAYSIGAEKLNENFKASFFD